MTLFWQNLVNSFQEALNFLILFTRFCQNSVELDQFNTVLAKSSKFISKDFEYPHSFTRFCQNSVELDLLLSYSIMLIFVAICKGISLVLGTCALLPQLRGRKEIPQRNVMKPVTS